MMREVLIVKRLSGDGFLVTVNDREYGFDSADSLGKMLCSHMLDGLYPKGPKFFNECIVTLEVNDERKYPKSKQANFSKKKGNKEFLYA